jgi:hypothetical protein
MNVEQAMMVIDHPSVLRAEKRSRWEGRRPYVGGSVGNDFPGRQSHIVVHPKNADGATGSSGGSATVWIVLGVVAAVVVAARRRRGRAVEE